MAYRRKADQLSIVSFDSGLSTPLSPDNEWVQNQRPDSTVTKCGSYAVITDSFSLCDN
jgi:hypothetical protein